MGFFFYLQVYDIYNKYRIHETVILVIKSLEVSQDLYNENLKIRSNERTIIY